jgi:hypothetical protein
MKKLILIFVLALFAITACKKENTGEMKTPQMNDSNKIETLILAFKDKLDNHLKDGTTYAADSAVWYVEALLNYSYGNATAQGCTFENDSVGTTLSTNSNNGYSLEQLALVYENLEDQILNKQPEGTYIFAIDVSLSVEANVSTFSSLSGYAKQLLGYKSTVDTSGYWYWGNGYGMCSSDSGSYVGMDASDILEGLINVNNADYYTSLETDVATKWDGYTDPFFPFQDQYLQNHRLFYALAPSNSNGAIHFCLSPSHISYFSGSSGIPYIIDDLLPNKKEFVYISIQCYSNSSVEEANHIVYITYGIPN